MTTPSNTSAPWQVLVQQPKLTAAAAAIAADDAIGHLDYNNAAVPAVADQQQMPSQHAASSPDAVLPIPAVVVDDKAAGMMVKLNPESPQLPGAASSSDLQAAGLSPADPAGNVPAGNGAEGALSSRESASYTPSLPEAYLKVACGDVVGTLLVHKAKIVMYEGTDREKEVSPTEFERLGGRSATKKWKQSIRLIADDGEPGRPVGEWYIQNGLEQPKKPREHHKDSYQITGTGSTSPTLTDHSADYMSGSSDPRAKGAAAAAGGVSRRPVRSTRGQAPAKQQAAADALEVAAASEGRHSTRHTMRRTVHTRNAAAAAAASADEGGGYGGQSEYGTTAGAAAAGWDDSGQLSAAAAYPGYALPEADPLAQQQQMQPAYNTTVDPNAQGFPWQQDQQQWQQQQQQQWQQPPFNSTPAAAATSPDEAAAMNLDYAALGFWQSPTAAPAAAEGTASGKVLVPIQGSVALPGDESRAVVEMTLYLSGNREVPPWRLLPPNQRPVVGQLLVPLRQLFTLVMLSGGYITIKDDLLTWQNIAAQLGLPSWPCPNAPDPLRVLQQVYCDYLLRFEGRFVLQDAAAVPQSVDMYSQLAATAGLAASAAGGGGSSSRDSVNSVGMALMQQPAAAAAAGMLPVDAPLGSLPSPGLAAAAAGGGVAAPLTYVTDLQQQRRLTDTNTSSSSSGGGGAAADAFQQQQQQGSRQLAQGSSDQVPVRSGSAMLYDGPSCDLLDFLTDLIPDLDAGGGQDLAQPPLINALPQQPAAATAAVDASNGSSFGEPPAADAAIGGGGPVARQHPEMTLVQQRQRLQQLRQQLQDQQTVAAAAPASLPGAGAAAGAHSGNGANANQPLAAVYASMADAGNRSNRAKRPAPLIRCGDSDLLGLMDQSEVVKLLQEYEQQQQQQQQQVLPSPPRQQQQQPPMPSPSGSQLAAAIAGAVDRNMSQDLQAMMQQYWHRQQQQQQQGPGQMEDITDHDGDNQSHVVVIEQQQQPSLDDLQAQMVEEEVSGLLDGLQLAAGAGQQQQQHSAAAGFSGFYSGENAVMRSGDQVLLSGDDDAGDWVAKLMGQASVGAHLVADLGGPRSAAG